MTYNIEATTNRFQVYGDFVSAQSYGSGHINDTYRIVFNQAGSAVPYIFQRINHHIFKDPPRLMDNIQRVTEHIRRRLIDAGVKDPSRRVLAVIPTKNGQSCYQDADGNYWRAFFFIAGAQTYDTIHSNEQAYRAAYAFGKFQEMLIDLPGPPLHETIPDFHNAPVRFKQFQASLKADRCSRAKLARPEIDFLLEQAPLFDLLPDLVAKGEIPVRITHNDTKINNVMVDEKTGEPVCIVDLDTVMPGLSLYDFGDLARTTLCEAAEDEIDLHKIEIDITRFKAIKQGYLAAAAGFLNQTEIEHLVTGAKMITLLIGMRFLADFLDGDRYFKTRREQHNLERCRVQFKLVRSIMMNQDKLT